MIVCDLCDRSKECLPKSIEGKEYDICSECWNPLARKLKGKGKTKEDREPGVAKTQEESPILSGDH